MAWKLQRVWPCFFFFHLHLLSPQVVAPVWPFYRHDSIRPWWHIGELQCRWHCFHLSLVCLKSNNPPTWEELEKQSVCGSMAAYLETSLKSFADNKQRNGVDAWVERCHVDAKIVQDKKDAKGKKKEDKHFRRKSTDLVLNNDKKGTGLVTHTSAADTYWDLSRHIWLISRSCSGIGETSKVQTRQPGRKQFLQLLVSEIQRIFLVNKLMQTPKYEKEKCKTMHWRR